MINPIEEHSSTKFNTILSDLRRGKRQFVTVARDSWFEEMIKISDVYPYANIRKAMGNNVSFRIVPDIESKWVKIIFWVIV